jgi:hypothetical protein
MVAQGGGRRCGGGGGEKITDPDLKCFTTLDPALKNPKKNNPGIAKTRR